MKGEVQPEIRRRFFTRNRLQFSVRSLLVVMTLAAIACWWFLQPQIREEQLGATTLRLRRQVQLLKYDPATDFRPTAATESIVEEGQHFAVVNAGSWRLSDHGRNLLVRGGYKNGEQHGKWTTYHANGRKAVEGRMLTGKKVGLWRTWDEDGKMLEEIRF
jgi:hypothetical protein